METICRHATERRAVGVGKPQQPCGGRFSRRPEPAARGGSAGRSRGAGRAIQSLSTHMTHTDWVLAEEPAGRGGTRMFARVPRIQP